MKDILKIKDISEIKQETDCDEIVLYFHLEIHVFIPQCLISFMTTSMEMKHINQVNSSHCQSQYLPGDPLLTAKPGNFATAILFFLGLITHSEQYSFPFLFFRNNCCSHAAL